MANGFPYFEDIIHLHKSKQLSNLFDVDLIHLEKLPVSSSMEIHIVLYPYSRQLNSNHFAFFPFEEYVKDILVQQRSAYRPIGKPFKNIFGLLLGLVIILIFAAFKPGELFAIDAILSVIGAYFIGKDLWEDIENGLIRITGQSRLRFLPQYYLYELEKKTTLTRYSFFAKLHRYGKNTILPDRMDFIQQSNSQTLRMFFDRRSNDSRKGNAGHIMSIHVDKDKIEEFENKGYLFGVKVGFNRTLFGFGTSTEFFQSLSGNSKGCLDDQSQWIEEGVFFRRTINLRRWKWYRSSGVLTGKNVIL